MGVKREKEPLIGMVPVKRLFDRSLHSTCKEGRISCYLCQLKLSERKRGEGGGLNNHNKRTDQLGTHRTCSERIVVKDTGIFPVKVLLLSLLSLQR